MDLIWLYKQTGWYGDYKATILGHIKIAKNICILKIKIGGDCRMLLQSHAISSCIN